MENETENNYKLFKALNKKANLPKIEHQPETVEQKEKREFFNFLFDKSLSETEIGRIPPEYNRSSVYCDFYEFVCSKVKDIKYIEVKLSDRIEKISNPDNDDFIENLTTDNWNKFLNTTYEPVKVEKNTKLNYITSGEDKAKKQMYDKIIASIKPLNPAPEQKDFSELLKALTPNYIKDCSTVDLQSIVIDKKLPLGRNRINWTGNKADAIRFIEHYSITKKQFNDMFILEDGKPLLAGHRDKNDTPSDLTDILQKH